MENTIQNIKNEALAQIIESKNQEELENIRINYLGRNGKITNFIKKIKDADKSERGRIGRLLNDVKYTIESQISDQKNNIRENTRAWFDPTIPGNKPNVGHTHLVTKAIDEISKTFERIGFVRVRYPEVDWDWFAFKSLNFPDNHPARDEWETFFVDAPIDKDKGAMLLTPHTSNGQVREMNRVKIPPIRMINIAKCYRRQIDVSHVSMFHQFEGLVIDKNITITNLKGTIDYFAKNFFGPDRISRLRPYHFQFTEPSFEVDLSCGICKGVGCRLCKAGWLELGGAGIVHPNVLKNGGIDPNIYSGFAFGWGVERTFMMKANLNIPDIRLIYSSNLNVLSQF